MLEMYLQGCSTRKVVAVAFRGAGRRVCRPRGGSPLWGLEEGVAVVLELALEDLEDLSLPLLVQDGEEELKPVLEVPGHEVGAGQVEGPAAPLVEGGHPGVLQKAPHQAPGPEAGVEEG